MTVPKHGLGDAEQLKIQEENGHIFVEPVSEAGEQGPVDDWMDDSFLGLGQNPALSGTLGASNSMLSTCTADGRCLSGCRLRDCPGGTRRSSLRAGRVRTHFGLTPFESGALSRVHSGCTTAHLRV